MNLDKTGNLPIYQTNVNFRADNNITKPDTEIKSLKPENTSTDDVARVPSTVANAYFGITDKKSETEKKADAILKELRKEMHADLYENDFPDVVKNEAKGFFKTMSEVNYHKYKTLETLRKENPEVFVYIGSEKENPHELVCMTLKYDDTPVNILKNMSLEELKKEFNETDKIYGYKPELDEWDENQGIKPQFDDYIRMLIIKKYNPDTYNYISTSEDQDIKYFVYGISDEIGKSPTAEFFKNITPTQIDFMVKNDNEYSPNRTHLAGEFVDDSNEFYKDKNAVQEFSEELSKCKIKKNVDLYRGEQNVGMFDTIALDKDFEKQVREILENNKDDAIDKVVSNYQGLYGMSPNISLYNLLTSKKDLSLADAMQVARYGDDEFINEVIQKIKDSKVTDNRFKSLSVDKGFSEGWMKLHSGDNSVIIQTATVKQGTEGIYYGGDNNQFEVILNNTPKEFTFQDVVYDKETNTFEIKSTIQNIAE